MAEKRITSYSPETARTIARYVQERIGTRSYPNTDISGRNPNWRKTFGEITGSSTVSGVTFHSWKEVRWNFTDKEFEDAPDGKSGSTSFNSIVVFPETGTVLTNGDIVEATKVEDPDTGENLWLAVSISLPTGQYQFMHYQMVAGNQSGWDYARAFTTV